MAHAQQAPKELQKVADAVAKQRKALDAGVTKGGGLIGQANGVLGSIGLGGISAAGAAAGFVTAAKSAVEYADALTKLSDRTGIGTVALQRLDGVAKASGNSIDQIATAVTFFQRQLAGDAEKTSGALSRIGLSIDEIRRLSPDEQFFAMAKGLAAIEDPAQRALAGYELFGRGASEIMPTLIADVDKLKDSTFTMSAETVAALDDAGDAFGRLKTGVVGIAGEIAGAVIRMSVAVNNLKADVVTAGGFSQRIALLGALEQAQKNAPKAGPTAPIAVSPVADEDAAKLLSDGLAEQIKQSVEAAKAAETYREASSRVALAMADWHGALKGINPEIAAQATTALRAGANINDVAVKYRLTALEARALSGALDFANAAVQSTIKSFGGYNSQIQIALPTTTSLADAIDELGPAPNLPRAITGLKALGEAASKTLQNLPKNLGERLRESVGDTLSNAPDTLIRSLEGGGGVRGAAQSLGSQLGSDLSEGLATSLKTQLGGRIGSVLSSIIGPLGSLVGPLIDKIINFGAPSAKELEGRDLNRSFESEIIGSLTPTQKAEAGSERWRQILVGVRDAYIAAGKSAGDAERDVKRLWDAEREGPEAAARVQREIQDNIDRGNSNRDGASRFGPSKTELKELADDARETYEYMRDSGEYSAEQIAEAFKASQEAAARAAGGAVAAQQKVTDMIQTALDTLVQRRDSLMESIASEAPEEVMGVIEAQTRGQIGALDAMIEAQREALKAQAEAAAEEIDTAVSGVEPDKIIVDVGWNFDPWPAFGGFNPIEAPEGAATGGLVTSRGIQHFAQGGQVLPFATRGFRMGSDTVPAMLTPGEIVLNAAQQGRVAGAMGGDTYNVSIHAVDAASFKALLHRDPHLVADAVMEGVRRGGSTYGAFAGAVKMVVR